MPSAARMKILMLLKQFGPGETLEALINAGNSAV
jgi:hypothetical protein